MEEQEQDNRTSETDATYVPRFILTLTISRTQPSTLDADTTMDDPVGTPAVPSSSSTSSILLNADMDAPAGYTCPFLCINHRSSTPQLDDAGEGVNEQATIQQSSTPSIPQLWYTFCIMN
jgi:hypothetical protein